MRLASGPLALGTALATALLAAPRAGITYRFSSINTEIGAAATAWRWSEGDFPLQFRLLENDLHPQGWSRDFLREVIEEAFAEWNAIPTSTFRAELADETLVARRADSIGINEIGFEADLAGFDLAALAAVTGSGSHIEECDIPLTPEAYDEQPSRARRWLKYVVMHELGHCLGLQHTEEYPMADWVGDVPSTFFPPPVMAYAWTSEPQLAEDDRIGASLLYPTRRFAESVGAVAGKVIGEDGPARFVYVQGLRPGTSPEPGPGAFTDENGTFLLEGLMPGPNLLWMHPLLPNYADPHPELASRATPAAGRSAIQDRWRWVNVRPGRTVVVRSLMPVTGRRARSR